eukprot:TRINITY_DN778143_c0_g1_i1.p1 TRINITY_DN778143_c0_g1~~TRINITY_DN778143_c0_g1_i1.p1  ORF type:complete len:282 (-),score=32.23 TRINITY_DN778143_c0_g1_i1:90-935(-)
MDNVHAKELQSDCEFRACLEIIFGEGGISQSLRERVQHLYVLFRTLEHFPDGKSGIGSSKEDVWNSESKGIDVNALRDGFVTAIAPVLEISLSSKFNTLYSYLYSPESNESINTTEKATKILQETKILRKSWDELPSAIQEKRVKLIKLRTEIATSKAKSVKLMNQLLKTKTLRGQLHLLESRREALKLDVQTNTIKANALLLRKRIQERDGEELKKIRNQLRQKIKNTLIESGKLRSLSTQYKGNTGGFNSLAKEYKQLERNIQDKTAFLSQLESGPDLF